MIKFFIGCYILICCCGAIAAIFTFVIDVIKWHPREKREVILPSAIESEVNKLERGDIGESGRGDNDRTSDRGDSDGNSGGDNNNCDYNSNFYF